MLRRTLGRQFAALLETSGALSRQFAEVPPFRLEQLTKGFPLPFVSGMGELLCPARDGLAGDEFLDGNLFVRHAPASSIRQAFLSQISLRGSSAMHWSEGG